MATIKVKLCNSTVEGNRGTTYYQLTHQRGIWRIISKIYLMPHKWDAQTGRVAACARAAAMFQSLID